MKGRLGLAVERTDQSAAKQACQAVGLTEHLMDAAFIYPLFSGPRLEGALPEKGKLLPGFSHVAALTFLAEAPSPAFDSMFHHVMP